MVYWEAEEQVWRELHSETELPMPPAALRPHLLSLSPGLGPVSLLPLPHLVLATTTLHGILHGRCYYIHLTEGEVEAQKAAESDSGSRSLTLAGREVTTKPQFSVLSMPTVESTLVEKSS